MGWLIKTASNLAFDWARERTRQNKFVNERRFTVASPESLPAQDESGVLVSFEKLSAADREILELMLLQGCVPKEAAERLGISSWAAYKRYERALTRLHALMESGQKNPDDEH